MSKIEPLTTGRDVILLAGQSNCQGQSHGKESVLDYPDPRILQYPISGPHIGQEILADDPLGHISTRAADEIGFPMSFARCYVQNSLRKLLLVPCAEGGTGFSNCYWRVGDDFFNKAVTYTNQALALDPDNHFVAILWHQGEEDAIQNMDANEYATYLDAMIAGLRANIIGASNAPFICGGIVPSWVRGASVRQAIQAQLEDLPNRVDNCGFVSAEGLLPQSDGIHFSAASQRILGKRYYQKFVEMLAQPPVAHE